MIPEADSALRKEKLPKSYATNFLDGDSTSNVLYNYGITSLISDKSRVYKGAVGMTGPIG